MLCSSLAVACGGGRWTCGRSSTRTHTIGPPGAALESRVRFSLSRRRPLEPTAAHCGLTAPPDHVCQSPPEMSSSSCDGSALLRRGCRLRGLADGRVAGGLDRVLDLTLGVARRGVAGLGVLLELGLGLLLALGDALAGLGERAARPRWRARRARCPRTRCPRSRRSRRPRRPRRPPRAASSIGSGMTCVSASAGGSSAAARARGVGSARLEAQLRRRDRPPPGCRRRPPARARASRGRRPPRPPRRRPRSRPRPRRCRRAWIGASSTGSERPGSGVTTGSGAGTGVAVLAGGPGAS